MNNKMKTAFSALAENEAFARSAAAAFVMPLDPTVEELTEIKTAVSEAVSNSVIHGYSGWEDRAQAMVEMECEINENGRVTITVAESTTWRKPCSHCFLQWKAKSAPAWDLQ